MATDPHVWTAQLLGKPMESQGASPNNPLGLNLDFLFGRGYLWAKHERLSDWITLEHLRMEIPDLKFPFDARGGLSRFRNTRCLVRDIEISTSEVGLGDLLRQAAADIDAFSDLDIHFLDGAIHVSARVKSLGANAYLSFRVALIPPEPARADEVHLSVYDYRSFGVLPYPARLLVFELMTRLLNTPSLRPPGRGQSFTVGIAGDILSFRPLKLMLLHIFPRVGWKLPNLSNVTLDGAQIRPGLMTLRAASRETGWASPTPPQFQLGATAEGARAIAAYEAKDLFASADQALFDSQIRQAMDLYAGYRDIYGSHRELVSRMLDCLVADPTPAHLAQAESICRELENDGDSDLQALMTRPAIALLHGRDQEVIEHYDRLSEYLRDQGDTYDWVLCEIAAAEFLKRSAPEKAAERLREVLKVSPRNRIVLETLKEIFEREGDLPALEEVLKRLTGVYTDRQALTQTYLNLARHLMDRQGELGEARIYLERVLRMDPTQLEALHTLGESYVMGGEPLRALKAFGSAARAAENKEDFVEASRLHGRVAKIWRHEVGDASQALMSCRRALALWDEADDARVADRAELLDFAAELCIERERWDEAIGYLVDVLPVLERELEAVVDASERESLVDQLVRDNSRIARVYEKRSRTDAAASHWRRVLELRPTAVEAAEHLERHYRMAGRPERLIELYQDLLRAETDPERVVDLNLRLAEIFESMDLVEETISALTDALQAAPAHPEPRRRLVTLLTASQRFETLRKLLNGLLVRVNDRDARWAMLMDLGIVQLEHLDEPTAATRTFLEAIQLRPAKVSALFQARDALEAFVGAEGPDAPAPEGESTAGLLLERMLGRVAEVAPAPEAQREALLRKAELAMARGDEATARESTRRAQEIRAETSANLEDVDQRLDELLDKEDGQKAHPALPEPPRRPEDPSPARRPTEDDERDARIQEFRKRFEVAVKTDARVPRLEDVEPDTSLGKVLKKRSEFDEAAPTQQVTTISAEQTEPGDRDLEAALERADTDTEQLEALEALLVADRAGEIHLSDERRISYARQAGELAYYELEDPERAQRHLQFVRDQDPEGAGAQPGILNALESIYEDSGEVEGRIALLEDRLRRAESEQMDTVYRLLLAQLVWEARGDRDEVEKWLDRVLARDARHEAAHRLLADVAFESADWKAAADHLRTVLAVSSGGLDSVEVERELAELLLTKLNRPKQAINHLRSVLEAAPGDSGALNRIKEAQAALGDWDGYVASLTHELGMLLGKPGSKPEDLVKINPEQVPTPLRVPASQIIADVAHVVQIELEDLEAAHAQWGLVYQLWPEHAEALERRIDLDRKLNQHEQLARDLERYADLLLDASERFKVLVESARLYAGELNDPEGARTLYTQALAIVEDAGQPPEGVDEARRALQALMNE